MITLQKIKPEDKLLFVLARQEFLHTHQKKVLDICSSEDIRWDIVYSTAKLHGVAPLIYSNLRRCIHMNIRIPQNIINQFKLYSFRNVVMEKHRTEKIMEVLSLLNKKSIDVMLIKGIALDVLVYDHPWFTIKNDVDLLLRPKREEVADKDRIEIRNLIKGRGFECDYFRHHDIDLGFLPINFLQIWNEAVKIKFKGYDVFVMSPEDMLIASCINSCRKRFFRLKNLCDIAEVINKYSDLEWEAVVTKSKEYHCNNIIYTALLVTRMTLGCEFPERVINDLTVNSVKSVIIRYIIHNLNQHVSLSSLYPFSLGNPLERKFNLSLVLPYATYNWRQVLFKMINSWKTIPKIRQLFCKIL